MILFFIHHIFWLPSPSLVARCITKLGLSKENIGARAFTKIRFFQAGLHPWMEFSMN